MRAASAHRRCRFLSAHRRIEAPLFSLGCLLFLGAIGGTPVRADSPTLQLRVAWGGSDSIAWQGSISVEPGRVIAKRSLGIEADQPGSMWIADNRLMFQSRTPRQYDGVDVTLVAPVDATLRVTLVPATGDSPPRHIEVPLAKLLDEASNHSLDDRGNRLLIRRSPGDALRVRVKNTSLVFAPGETLKLDIEPNVLGVARGSNVSVRWRLLPGRGDEKLWEQEKDIVWPGRGEQAEPISVQFEVPEREGVYDLAITAHAPTSRPQFAPGNPFRNRQQAIARRRVQFLVLDTTAPGMSPDQRAESPNKLVDEINPDKPWWLRVPEIPKLPRWRHGPFQHGSVKTWHHPQFGNMIRLGAGATEPNATWTAYPLSIRQPGQAHILELQYPSDVPQAMGISVMEPNSAGSVLPIGLDSGLFIDESSSDEPARMLRHRIVFWPRTRDPVVLITNQRDDGPAVHGNIRVLGPKRSGVGRFHLGAPTTTHLAPALPRGTPVGERLLSAYMERPLIPESFSATEAFDPWSKRSMDDWVTFYEGGTRLVEMLQHAGYNGLTLSVLASGSTIYPSRFLEPTPRYDSGAFFTTGQDPVRKDVLEMLFRLCDREGLRLIPTLQFTSPLPELEDLLRRGGSASVGIELVNGRGRTWQATHAADGGPAALYNPLHPQVQQAMFRVVRELVQRYRHHRSFAGLAIGTSGQGYALLPGADWALDDVTRAQFTHDTRLTIDPDTLAQRAPTDEKLRQAWLQWRAKQLRVFYGHIARELGEAAPKTKLYLSAAGLVASPDVERTLRPALPSRWQPHEALTNLGIDPALYEQDAAAGEVPIVLLRPRSIVPDFEIHKRATTLAMNDSETLDQYLQASPHRGALLMQTPQPTRLESFDKQSPFGADATHTLLVPHLVPSGRLVRRRFLRALAAQDLPDLIDGGWMMPLSESPEVRDLLVALRKLPADRFQTIEGDHQPVIIRTLHQGAQTYVYFLNDSPWKCQVVSQVTASQRTTMETLSGPRTVASPEANGWSVDLEPYDLVAVRFDDAKVTIGEVQVRVPEGVQQQLQTRIRNLVARTAELTRPTTQELLANPDFEQVSESHAIPGWQLEGTGKGVDARITADQKYSGNGAAQLASGGTMASLVSQPIEAPRTGRLTIHVWLRAGPKFRGPLRLALSGQHNERPLHRTGIVPVTDQWKEYRFPTDDLPLDDLTDLRIRFDLMGPGVVWIDDVTTTDRRFTENERTELTRLLTRANFALQGKRWHDCDRMLNSYWPRFLESHVSLPEVAVTPDRQPEREATLPAPPKTEESWWKRKLPGFLR